MQEWQETQALKLFLLLYWKKNTDLISERRNHASVIVKGSEKHHTLKDSFGNAFTNIKKITLEFFLGGGGDYKLILIMLGLKGATAFYACTWHKVHKDHR